MAGKKADIHRVFHALGDPTRRMIMEKLSAGPVSVSHLAVPLKMTLAAVVQHLQVLEESGLVRTDQVGSFLCWQKLNRNQRRRDVLGAQAHRRRRDNAFVEHNVLIASLVGQRDALKRGVVNETIPGSLGASDSKIHLKLLDVVAFTFGKPAALLGRVGESREHALNCLRIAALDDECAVDHRLLFHRSSFLSCRSGTNNASISEATTSVSPATSR